VQAIEAKKTKRKYDKEFKERAVKFITMKE
jgi:transposase-like protein